MNHRSLQQNIKSSEKFFHRAGNDAYFDWGIILGLFFIVALALMIMNANLFFSINADGNTEGNMVAQTETGTVSTNPVDQILDSTDLTNLISIFQSKNAQASVFTATYPGPSDPAVPIKFVTVPVKSSVTTKISTTTGSPIKGSPAKGSPAK